MRVKGLEIIMALLLGILIPALLIAILQDRIVVTQDAAGQTETTILGINRSQEIEVLQKDGTVATIPVEEYVLSVVLSEMPANFELEALKAQAVVARTYALRRTNRNAKHGEASVCVKASCCQGYCSTEDYLSGGGTRESVEKIQAAVDATEGLVLVYENELIDATYFACSGGVTEDAQAVWGAEIPYLKSVESPGEEGAAHYVDTVRFTLTEFADRLGIDVLDETGIMVGKIESTNGNGVASIEICGKIFSGTQIRKLLKLRSTAFLISVVGETVTVTTKGFGHRVGMSQYGADAMAVNGATFQEILSHYYLGTQLIPFNFD